MASSPAQSRRPYSVRMSGVTFRQEDLSYPVRVALYLASEEPRRLGHPYTTGNLLLALLHEEECVAAPRAPKPRCHLRGRPGRARRDARRRQGARSGR